MAKGKMEQTALSGHGRLRRQDAEKNRWQA